MFRILTTIMSLGLFVAFAQPQTPNPEARALMEPYFNLISTVNLLVELESQSTLGLSSEQAVELLPVLNELANSPGYTSERATELLNRIELEILTVDQLIWIDGAFLKQQEEALNANGNRPGGGLGGFAGVPPNDTLPLAGSGPNATPPQGQRGGAGGIFQQIQAGQAINIFLDNPKAMDALQTLIVQLQDKEE